MYIHIQMKESHCSRLPTNPPQQNHAKLPNTKTAVCLEVGVGTIGI